MDKFYAGVGSCELKNKDHEIVQDRVRQAGNILAWRGWVLRSGAAEGTDSFFEQGCDSVYGMKEIYLPWKDFNRSKSPLFDTSQRAFEIAKEIHAEWWSLGPYDRRRYARSVHQVLGRDLKSASKFVLCWTNEDRLIGGGIRTAIKVAERYAVPVYNLGDPRYNTIEISKLLDEILESRSVKSDWRHFG